MRKLILFVSIFALPLVLIGVDGRTQTDSNPFWVTFSHTFHAPPEFLTISVFGNGGSADQFNFGGLDLRGTSDGFVVDQEFTDIISKVGNSLEACDSGLQMTGSSFFDVLEVRLGQRWEGEVVLGENRSICVDLTADPELGGDYLIFQVRLRARTDGQIFFNAKPDSITASFNGTPFDPINVLLYKVEIDVP